MKWSDRLWRWLIADPEQSTLYDAIDQELSRQDPNRLDTRDGVLRLPCWETSSIGWLCTLTVGHIGDHLAEDVEHTVLDVWPQEEVRR